MKKQPVFILCYNNAVQFASKDVSVMHGAMMVMCANQNLALPHSYVQVTRVMNEHHTYTHIPDAGHSFQIITRELMYKERKRKQGNTTPP